MMESCEYEPVNSYGDKTSAARKFFFRQFLVSSSVWILYFILGLCNGAPTVIIPQLRREANSTAAVSDEMASWMSSVHGYAAIPWVIILPLLTEHFGRKLPFLFVSISGLCSFILFYFSTTITQILIGELIQGVVSACITTINSIIVTEYSSPKYRGIFLTLKVATFTWGLWCSNALGTFFHWKTISVVGIITSVYCIVNSIFWTESPYWLASKGLFERCAVSHRWLKGRGVDSEKELMLLLESHQIYFSNKKDDTVWKRLIGTIFNKDFYKPMSLCLVTLALFNFSGKLVCAVYAIDILKKITDNESAAYTGMLISDGVSVLGMYVGCALSRFLKRRTLLLTGSSIGILFLFGMSLYLYLIELSVLSENKYVSISLLSIFSLAICCGPMLMSSSIYGELVPLRFRSFSIFVTGLFHNVLMATMLKISPFLFKNFKLWGTFLFYGVMSTICTVLLYKYLPETKDKTLQEIEDSLKIDSSNLRLKPQIMKKTVIII